MSKESKMQEWKRMLAKLEAIIGKKEEGPLPVYKLVEEIGKLKEPLETKFSGLQDMSHPVFKVEPQVFSKKPSNGFSKNQLKI